VDLEAADAGGDVDDPHEVHGSELGFQSVDAKTQGHVKDYRAELYEEVAVAIRSSYDGRCIIRSGE
jgi:hypothetical protein